MELTKIQRYKLMQTATMPNIKEIIGETIRVTHSMLNDYADKEGELHTVLSIRTADGKYYRTEVKIFLDNFAKYWECFGEDEADRPAIRIVGTKSQRGNPGVNFEIIEQ